MLANRVKETTTGTGTGNLTLAGAATNFQSFNSAFGTDIRFSYFIVDDTNNDWEHGIGYLSASTTLVRESVLNSTNSDAAVNFSAGTKDVFCDSSAQSLLTVPNKNPSGDWMQSLANLDGANSNNAVIINTQYAFPYYLGCANKVDALGIYVASASGTKMRLGIYEWNNGEPGALLVETSDLDPSTTGFKSATFTAIDISNRWVWVAVVSDGTTSLASGDYNAQLPVTPVNSGSSFQWLRNTKRDTLTGGWTNMSDPWVTSSTEDKCKSF